MENLNELTLTELLVTGNKLKKDHDDLKIEIINDSVLIEELNEKLNAKLKSLDNIEQQYIKIIEEITKRNGK